jgi:hypothetical protein
MVFFSVGWKKKMSIFSRPSGCRRGDVWLALLSCWAGLLPCYHCELSPAKVDTLLLELDDMSPCPCSRMPCCVLKGNSGYQPSITFKHTFMSIILTLWVHNTMTEAKRGPTGAILRSFLYGDEHVCYLCVPVSTLTTSLTFATAATVAASHRVYRPFVHYGWGIYRVHLLHKC